MDFLKSAYQRFAEWQREPRNYETLDPEIRHCSNCGQEHAGNFCPRCGQRVAAGRITWKVVRQSVMDVWGLGGRSFPYSLWQLLWRPGYFISDYIGGKWQSSFPPVKMLVLVAVIIYFVGKAIFPKYWNMIIEEDPVAITSTGWEYFVDSVNLWIGNHVEWMFLFLFSFLILPTWLVFRHSPRNTRHTLPQGFFIQVFMTTEYIMWIFIISSCVKLAGIDLGYIAGSSGFEDMVIESSLLLIPVIVAVNYKQLFGYGWWGTVWRLMMILFSVVTGFFALSFLWAMLTLGINDGKYLRISLYVIFLLLCMLMSLSVADVINRRLWQEKGWLRAMMLPLSVIFISIVIGVYIESIKPGSLLSIFSVF